MIETQKANDSKPESIKAGPKSSDWISNADDWGSDEEVCQDEIEEEMEQEGDELLAYDRTFSRNVRVDSETKTFLTELKTVNKNESILNKFAQINISQKKAIDEHLQVEIQNDASSSSNSSHCTSPFPGLVKDATGRDSIANSDSEISGIKS